MRARLAAIALVIPLGLAACATGVAELPADARAVDLQGRAAVVGRVVFLQPALAAALVTRLMAYDPAIPHDPAEADRNAWLQILNAIGFGLLVVR
ncbi:MAG: hypothetical protein HYU41_20275 [Candidatus Rokubacteria bacterium]|nr:hypothetical protein [Candidatus Rokubacteria bacterium]